MKTRQVPITPAVFTADETAITTRIEYCHRYCCPRCNARWSEWQASKEPEPRPCPECTAPPEDFFLDMKRMRERVADLMDRGFGGRSACRNSNIHFSAEGGE